MAACIAITTMVNECHCPGDINERSFCSVQKNEQYILIMSLSKQATATGSGNIQTNLLIGM